MADLFTTDFQLKFLYWFCKDEESKFYLEYLQPKYFATPMMQWLAEAITQLRAKYFPLTQLMFETEYKVADRDKFSELEEQAFQGFLRFFDSELDFEFDYISQLYIKYVNSLNLRETLELNRDLIEEGNWDELTTLLSNNKSIIHDAHIYDSTWSIKNFEEIFRDDAVFKVNVGFIDNKMRGLYRKELLIVMADTGCGKSAYMTFLGSRLVRNGYKVLHLTLELSQARTLIRYGAALSDDGDNMTHDRIEQAKSHPEELLRFLIALENRHGKNPIVVEYPSNVCTIGDVERWVNLINPDILILDYLDLLRIPTVFSDKRFGLTHLTTELRRIASEYDIHVMTASQSNRTQRRKREVDISGIAEDYEKARIADNIIALGMNKSDKEKNEVILNAPKTRNAKEPEPERHKLDFQRLRYSYLRPFVRKEDQPNPEDVSEEDSDLVDVKLKNRKWSKANSYD